MKYRKKPVVIEAVKFNMVEYTKNGIEEGAGFEEIPSWLQEAIDEEIIVIEKNNLSLDYVVLIIHTLEGPMKCSPGDYIIKGVKGEFCPCKSDIFELTYEKVE